jgi:uncharacterized repeat protein (TIGR03803 family)
LNGSTLYGTTRAGGDADVGTVFKVNIDGSGYQVLHEFLGGVDDGDSPYGGLVRNGSVLYGTTSAGGDGLGTVFEINIDGTGFDLLHEFPFDEASAPFKALTLHGSVLYGTTSWAGPVNTGAVFRMNIDGTGYDVLHEFSGDDGRDPSELVLDGSLLYGTTVSGGNGDCLFGCGTVFALSILSGDYSVDGAVDAQDYGVWKNAFGTSQLSADGNRDGSVDAADFVVWRKSISSGSTPGGTGATIPEPATIWIAAVILASTGATFRKRPVSVPMSFLPACCLDPAAACLPARK